jgi:hypothetical protein
MKCCVCEGYSPANQSRRESYAAGWRQIDASKNWVATFCPRCVLPGALKKFHVLVGTPYRKATAIVAARSEYEALNVVLDHTDSIETDNIVDSPLQLLSCYAPKDSGLPSGITEPMFLGLDYKV